MNKVYMKGFTMIELVMVLVIVGILASIAGSRFFSTSGYQTVVYYDEVRNSIRYARKLAVATGGYIQVTLTATSITLQRLSACPAGTLLPITDPSTEISGYVKTAPTGVTMTGITADWPLYFNGLGQALSVATCAVVGSDSVTIAGNTVTVIGQTGFVQ